MRIGIQTWGSEGDLRPFFALGQGLAARGHEVTLAYTSVEGRDYSALAAACGLRAVDAGSEQFRRHPVPELDHERAILAGSQLHQFRWAIDHLLEPVVEPMWAAAEDLALRSDLLVGHFFCHPVAAAAARARRPLIGIATVPSIASREYPPPGMPFLGPLNRLAWRLAEVASDRVILPRANALRARAGVPPLAGGALAGVAGLRGLLTTVSPSLFPQPRDWPAKAPVVGFLDFERPAEPWTPPPDLEAFLSDGPPPVFMTFGSMMSVQGLASRSAELLRTAAEAAGVRAILQAPAGAIQDGGAIRVVGRLPHAAVLPRCAAVVHHGGAGTTQAALAAGRPSVVVPHLLDQFFWGELLRRRGIAPRPIARRRATARALAARIREAVGSAPMRARAEALGAALREERGVARAVEAIERLAADG